MNYAVVELDFLAIQWAIEKCRLYLAGTEFTVVTDHQPLLGIINRKNLDAINNVRIQRLMAKLLGYSFRLEWTPGKNHHIADSLSRNPVFAAPDHKYIIIRQVTEGIMDENLAEMSDVAKTTRKLSPWCGAAYTTARRLRTSAGCTLYYSTVVSGLTWPSMAYF
jgi:hypothetical protein